MTLTPTTMPQWCSFDRQGSAGRHGRASGIIYRGLTRGEPSAFLCLKLMCPPFLRVGFRSRFIYHSLDYAPAIPTSPRAHHDNLTLSVYDTYVFGWNVK
ncbi:hypothetical protein P171DRAFT_196275 [Karstenula rhodostoma CBS 690.94]|uniref:Uncharacterized protein n=1 Tax=Karstenula rhodostoma CBS 690.94 TaxID=1392251 RepID=A0A9P4PSW4_9PLEO|nr:hypothetical protein P171DRAFT_196275 [Karstenula rhodostoma CBS 690.94]